MQTRRKLRADYRDATAAISRTPTNRDVGRFPGPICQFVRDWAQGKRARGGDARASLCVTLREERHAAPVRLGLRGPRQTLRKCVVDRVARGETA